MRWRNEAPLNHLSRPICFVNRARVYAFPAKILVGRGGVSLARGARSMFGVRLVGIAGSDRTFLSYNFALGHHHPTTHQIVPAPGSPTPTAEGQGRAGDERGAWRIEVIGRGGNSEEQEQGSIAKGSAHTHFCETSSSRAWVAWAWAKV